MTRKTSRAAVRLPAERAANKLPGRIENFEHRVRRLDRTRAVGNDQVTVFAFQLLHRPHPPVFRLQREGHQPLRLPNGRQAGHDVGRLHQAELERLAVFGDLLIGDLNRAIVTRRRGGNQPVATGKASRQTTSISSVETTHRTSTPSGYATSTGPLTTNASCPASSTASASAAPIRPLDALLK